MKIREQLLFLYILLMPLVAAFGNGIGKDSLLQFRNPVNHPIQLTGTFGELRTNHFHTGIDIRSSRGIIGDDIITIAKGYISRIKIQSGGYGKVLYINHPNGYTSVYAHLNEFSSEVEQFVRKYQYENKTFEVDFELSPAQFPIENNEIIGTMGVTGRSFGPHLHFEIRETQSERPVNPLLLNIVAKDTRPPELRELHFYAKDKSGRTRHLFEEKLNQRITGTHSISDTILISENPFAIGLKLTDRFDGLSSRNGIYHLKMMLDTSLVFEAEFDEVSFAEYRLSNSYMDYSNSGNGRPYISRLHRLPGVHLGIFKHLRDDGFIHLEEGKSSRVIIHAADIYGNQSELKFWVKMTKTEISQSTTSGNTSFIAYHDRDNLFIEDEMKLWIPECTLPENLALNISKTEDLDNERLTTTYHIHKPEQALLKEMTLSINIDDIPDRYKEYCCLVFLDGVENNVSIGGKFSDQTFTVDIKSFGNYKIEIDTLPPIIKPIKWSQNWSGRTSVSFKITDNFIASGDARELQYDAYLGNQWLLFEYDKKSDEIQYNFDEKLSPGLHDFILLVKDDRGNTQIFEAEIKY